MERMYLRFILFMMPSAACFSPVHIELLWAYSPDDMVKAGPNHLKTSRVHYRPKSVIRISHRTRIVWTCNEGSQGVCQAQATYDQNCFPHYLDSRKKFLTALGLWRSFEDESANMDKLWISFWDENWRWLVKKRLLLNCD